MERFLDKFILHLKFELRFSENTVKSYNYDLNNYFIFIKNKNIDITNVKDHNITDYIKFLTENNNKASSINRLISAIKKFYSYLEDNDIILHNPSLLIEAQKHQRVYPNILTVEEIEKIINHIKADSLMGFRNLSMITIMYSCGIRVSELINLEFSNLFLKNDYIKILGKGKKERLVPIGQRAKENLVNYMNYRKKNKITSDGYIYLSYRNKQLTRMAINNIIKKYCFQAEINKKISAHTFRHSFATHMLEGGADLRVVQEILGHENINTTEIYTHLDNIFLKEVHKQCHPRG